MSLENCVLTNNFAGPGFLDYLFGFPGGDGGAIYNAGTLTAKNCIIAGNSAGAGSGSDDGGNGGGIKNDGVCTLTDCMISENKGGDGGLPSPLGIGGNGGNGGGICNSGTAALSGCFIAANLGGPGAEGDTSFAPSGHADGDGGNGGGIYNTGSMQISSSTVYGNIGGSGGNDGNFSSTNTAGAGGTGGGIFNLGALSMNNSTVSGNRAGNGGLGADENYVTGGVGGSGGGIYNRGPLQLTSCTIALNETGTGGNAGSFGFYSDGSTSLEPGAGGPAGDGGGIFTDGAPTNCFARNTLIALNLTGNGGNAGTITLYPTTPGADIMQLIGNPGANGTGVDIAGGFTSQGFNLIGVGDGGVGFTNGLSADQIGNAAVSINPMLGPLQMNGGETPTQALLPGSPAIDQGNSFHIFTDQRGMRRLRNFPAIPNAQGGDGSDIGAFELR